MSINKIVYSYEWKLPLVVLLCLMVVSTPVFWFTDLDIRCAAFFYSPPPALDPWPQELTPLWRFFYYAAPLFASLFAVGSLALIIAGPELAQRRRYAAFILFTIALGPGLLVNLVFKDHWGRPRPRQLEIFGGASAYLPPLAIGTSTEDKSFPAGHASVGFSLCVFWLLWRRSRPHWAKAALAISIFLGLLIGLGRMATGAHFLSDVLWAGFICFFTAIITYHFILRIPHWETQTNPRVTTNNFNSISAMVIYTSIGLLVLIGAMLGFPIDERIDYRLTPELLPLPHNMRLDLRYAQLTLHLNNTEMPPMHVTATIQGFGLPTYRIDSRSYIEVLQDKTLVYQFRQRGFFTELETKLNVSLNVANLTRLTVRLRQGNIRVIAAHGVRLPQLDLHTQKGQVLPLVVK